MLKSLCVKYGEVKKVSIYDVSQNCNLGSYWLKFVLCFLQTNPDGIATVTFETPEMADDCLTMTDYRQLRGRQVRAERWDGKTKYKVAETEEERQKRIALWEEQLEEGGRAE